MFQAKFKNGLQHLKIATYEDPLIFLNELEQYAYSTKIILDYYFYFDYDERVDTTNGLTVAEQLYKKGYTNLYLCTAEDIDSNKIPSYLKLVNKIKVYDEREHILDLSVLGF